MSTNWIEKFGDIGKPITRVAAYSIVIVLAPVVLITAVIYDIVVPLRPESVD